MAVGGPARRRWRRTWLIASGRGTNGRVAGWRGSWIMPGFVRPYASAVTVNRRQDLFHPSPPEPCLQLSKHTALQFPDSYRIQHVGITPTSSLMFRQTCPPLPCTGLSSAQTTMGAPSPWGSRPLGDLEFLRDRTKQHDLGHLFIPTPRLYGLVSHRVGLPLRDLSIRYSVTSRSSVSIQASIGISMGV
jgi:hypothetical protein